MDCACRHLPRLYVHAGKVLFCRECLSSWTSLGTVGAFARTDGELPDGESPITLGHASYRCPICDTEAISPWHGITNPKGPHDSHGLDFRDEKGFMHWHGSQPVDLLAHCVNDHWWHQHAWLQCPSCDFQGDRVDGQVQDATQSGNT